ncbi:MAG: hypothetical protein RL260_1726 [Pseudomonadota bacterium]
MIPLLTTELLTELDACDRAQILLSQPDCPPLPLSLADALDLIDHHTRTEKYAAIAQMAAGAARWIAAKVLSEATEATAEEISALHHPELGIVVDCGGARTVVCQPETLTLVLMEHGAEDCGLLIGSDSHTLLFSPCHATAYALGQSDKWHGSVCGVAPNTRVHVHIEDIISTKLKVRKCHGLNVWRCGGEPCSAPY